MLFQGESADENPCDFGAVDFVASDIGAGTEDTYLSIPLRVAGRALDEKYRFSSTAGEGFAALFAHAVTADRTYTLPDTTGTVALTSDITGVTVGAGTFTRDISAGGSQVVAHGMSVTPTAIFLVASNASAASNFGSVGMTNGTTNVSAANDNAQNAGMWLLKNAECINFRSTTGNQMEGRITSIDGTNFTVTWTLSGSISGTMTIGWIAIG